MSLKILLANQPNRIALEALTDRATAAVVTTATVTHTLRDADGTVVSGESARSCAHDTGGTYRATIPQTAPLVAGRAYRGTYVVDIAGAVSAFVVDYRADANAL
jgi:hypothetical protein